MPGISSATIAAQKAAAAEGVVPVGRGSGLTNPDYNLASTNRTAAIVGNRGRGAQGSPVITNFEQGSLSEADRLLARYPNNTTLQYSSPEKASAAPQGSTMYAYVGLADAMNSYEESLVTAGVIDYPNKYAIEFVSSNIASASIDLKGPTSYAQTSSAQSLSAKSKLLSESNTVDMKGKNISIVQGTQIIQCIEMILRNSTFITDQLIATQNQLDPSAKAMPNASVSDANTTKWFNILVNAVPYGDKIDTKRHDYPYQITYIVTEYAINEMESQFFPNAQFRGVHKLYDYWFTGQNTQVLHYEQSYNNQYINVLSQRDQYQGKQGVTDELAAKVSGWYFGPNKNVPGQTARSTQGSPNDANFPTATGADYLYSFEDQATVNLKIIGDPAWLVQGESKGITSADIGFNGFYQDGSVCAETQQIVFAINFNAPEDYDNGDSGPYSGTGLMNVNGSATVKNNNLSSTPTQASAAYTTISVKSTFSKGRFEQELKGNALKNLNMKQLSAVTGREADTRKTLGNRGDSVLNSNGNNADTAIPSGARTGIGNMNSSALANGDPAHGIPTQAQMDVMKQVNSFESALPQIPTPSLPAVGVLLRPITPALPPSSNGSDVGPAAPADISPPYSRPVTPGSLRANRTLLPSANNTTSNNSQIIAAGDDANGN
jgi:hypothetical protein